ncbi:MAG TPA: protein kinase, partial [Gemmataceae bacterium]|nr:protein kinase [Gemmataceae bacterium]
YFSMKLIEGSSLAEQVTTFRGDHAASACVLAQVARAVHVAHQHGLLHRDLKPANILLDRQRHPHVTDFGLAKHLTSKSDLSQPGAIVGTAGYMSPEQAAAQTGALSPAADVFSLGAVLYELLTGRPPFQATTVLETLRAVIEREPPRPRLFDRRIPRDLETICLKCLDKRPHRRYTTALALAQDLEAWLEGRPIRGRPVQRPERVWLWSKRHPGTVMACIAIIFLGALLSVAAVLVHQGEQKAEELDAGIRQAWQDQERARQGEERASKEVQTKTILAQAATQQAGQIKTEANNQRTRARTAEYADQVLRAFQEWQAHHLRRAREILASCRLDMRNWEHDYVQQLCLGGELALPGPKSMGALHQVDCLTFSEDGARLAAAYLDGQVQVWDASTGRTIFSFANRRIDQIRHLTFSHTGKLLASAGTVSRVWDLSRGREVRRWQNCRRIAFSPDDKCVAAGGVLESVRGKGTVGYVIVYDLATGKERFRVVHNAEFVDYSPDGQRLASSGGQDSDHNAVRMWQATDGHALPLSRARYVSYITSLGFSPDGRLLAGTGVGQELRIWDTRTGQVICSVDGKGEPGYASATTFSSDGERLTSVVNGQATVWDLNTRLPALSFHEPAILRLAFSRDNLRRAGSDRDGIVRIWQSADANGRRDLVGHNGDVRCVAFSPDGHLLASGSRDRTVRLWNADASTVVRVLKGHAAPVVCVGFSPSGQWLASGSDDGLIKIWDVATGQERYSFHAHHPFVRCLAFNLAFSPDGRWLASAAGWGEGAGGLRGELKVWDPGNGRQVLRPAYRGYGAFSGVTFSPDGHRLISATTEGAVLVWELPSGKLSASTQPSGHRISALALSPDGKWLATTEGKEQDADGWPLAHETILRDAHTGRQAFAMRELSGSVTGLGFNPDGSRLATGVTRRFDDQGRALPAELKFWDVATGEQVFRLEGPGRSVAGVAFSPDGSRVAAALGRIPADSVRGVVAVWQAATQANPITLSGNTAPVTRVLFSPDDRYLASVSATEVKFWDVRSGQGSPW